MKKFWIVLVLICIVCDAGAYWQYRAVKSGQESWLFTTVVEQIVIPYQPPDDLNAERQTGAFESIHFRLFDTNLNCYVAKKQNDGRCTIHRWQANHVWLSEAQTVTWRWNGYAWVEIGRYREER